MGSDKKFFALVLVTAVVVLLMVFLPYEGSVSLARYLVTDFGQFSILFVAALIGIERARYFTYKSAIGKSFTFISAYLLFWGAGVLLWLYYNVIYEIEVPYPSLADAFFLATPFLSSYGMFWLLKNFNLAFDRRTVLKLMLLPSAVFLVVYLLFLQSKLVEDVPALTKLLDVAYPVGDAVVLSLTLVVLSLLRGGKLFKPISLLCVGFILEAIADFSFSWMTSAGTYYTGNWIDVLYAIGFFFIGAGMHFTTPEEPVGGYSFLN